MQESEEHSENHECLGKVKAAMLRIIDMFQAPLEAKGVKITSSLNDIEDIVEYARAYLQVGCDSYKKIWYLLKKSPDSVKWPNIFLICDLLFSLPFATAKVERFFSTLKIIKNERKTSLSCLTLNDLLEVNVEGPTLSDFSPDQAVDIWWSSCQSGRRVDQKPRKEYHRNQKTTGEASSDFEEETEVDIDKWDSWFGEDEEEQLKVV